MIDSAYKFLDKLFLLLEENKIDISSWEIDHLCYRTSSLENYHEIKNIFSKLGKLLIESDVNGRDIATYKLFEPVIFRNYIIPLVEVPAPKAGRKTAEGWEHIEVVIDINFDDLINKYDYLKFDTKALSKELNPELVFKFNDCSIKFHHQSLEEVIRIESEILNS